MNLHQNMHNNAKPFECNKCDAAFSSPGNLRNHMFSHMEEAPFPCKFCPRRFTRSGRRDAHENEHTNETPFSCDHENCEEAFFNARQLRIHKFEHTGRPFACPFVTVCNHRSLTKGELIVHIRVHTGEKPYSCDRFGCEKKFAAIGTLISHKRTHTGEFPYECADPNCDATFAQSSPCKRHYQLTHTERAIQRRKVQEERIARALDASDIKYEREVRIAFDCANENSHCYSRIDFVIYTDRCIFLLEVDEHQHRYYEVICEIARMSRTHTALALSSNNIDGECVPMTWVRYNPHKFTVQGAQTEKARTLRRREERLIDVINNYDPFGRPLSIIYMFYNAKRAIDGTLRPSVVDHPDYDRFMKQTVQPAIVN